MNLHIAHVLRKYNPDQWGGTETALQQLLDSLQQHGVTPVVFCPRLEQEPASDPLRDSGCRVERFRAFVPVMGISSQYRQQLISVGGNLLSFDLLPALWRERHLDVIHTHALGRIGGIALTVAKRRRIPLVVTIHGGALDLPPQLKEQYNSAGGGGWEWGRIFGLLFQSRRLFRDADAILACNESEAGLLRERYPDRRVLVQPHGVPTAAFESDQRDHALQAFPAIAGKQMVLCVGRIDPVKNQGWLIEQAPLMFKKHPHAILVLAGACTNADYGSSLQRRLDELGLQQRVLITGGLPPCDPRLLGLFQLANVLVVPSISETFGLIIVEAWAAGTVVLSSRTSGASSLLRQGQNGWLFDLTDPGCFHERLDQVLNHPGTMRDVIRRGADEARRCYDNQSIALKMKLLYEQLLEEKNALRDSSGRRYQCVDAD